MLIVRVTTHYNNLSVYFALVKTNEDQASTSAGQQPPVEAPGAAGIGSVALIICIVEMVGFLVLDIDSYVIQLKMLYGNLKAIKSNLSAKRTI